MQISTYAIRAEETAVYPAERKIVYPMFGLVGEVGEFCNKYKKIWRDGRPFPAPDQVSELGDMLWYWTMLCIDLKHDPTEVAVMNITKLRERLVHGNIHGSGDHR